MLLIKRICQSLGKPVFEVLSWPVSELSWWSAFFSIDDHKDKPIVKRPDPASITPEQSIEAFRQVMM